MRKLLAEVDTQLSKFVEMRHAEDANGRSERAKTDSKIRRQYLQGRIESLEEIRRQIQARLAAEPTQKESGS